MPKPTKSSGIRMPTETYDWIDRLAAKHDMNRSQCVCRLVKVAKSSLAPKPSRIQPKQPWTVNVAWAGYSCASIVTALSLVEFIRQF